MTTPRYNIAFWGTPPFTIDFLEVLRNTNLDPALIITTPDTRAGRGMSTISPMPKKWGEEHNVPVLQPDQLDDAFYKQLSETPWDLFIVIAYGKILPERFISLPRFGTINVHYSLLPTYRGASPVESAILHGETITGVTIQQMKYELDSGDILSTKEVTIEPSDTTPSLRKKLNHEAVQLLPEIIHSIFQKMVSPIPQDEVSATYCKKIKKTDGLVVLDEDSVALDRKFRAYTPWPGIFFFIFYREKEIRVKITKAHLEGETFIIDEVVPENNAPMSYETFLNWQNN
jgi:methionyl-tRNA formyltransferase